MFRAVDLHHFTQTVPPPARLIRRGQPMTAINPQSIGDLQTVIRSVRSLATGRMLATIMSCGRCKGSHSCSLSRWRSGTKALMCKSPGRGEEFRIRDAFAG
jgi:hypothetical protein